MKPIKPFIYALLAFLAVNLVGFLSIFEYQWYTGLKVSPPTTALNVYLFNFWGFLAAIFVFSNTTETD